mmetsp:Transcript_15706/g.51518  ORF Transcript_15706/g.51518 Transcript_15706/m.51518 type:complete len:422 (+) Transcript_15706:1625-2890(+)
MRPGVLILHHRLCRLANLLEVSRKGVVRRSQMDAIVVFGHLYRSLPLPRRLVELVEEVPPLALRVELDRLVVQAELDGHRRHARVELRFRRRLAHRTGAADVTHVPEAHLRHVEALRLDAQRRHILPHRWVFDLLHRLVRLLHVPNVEKVGKVEQRLARLVIHAVHPGKVAHDGHGEDGVFAAVGVPVAGNSPVRKRRPGGGLHPPPRAAAAVARALQQHEVRSLQPNQALDARVELVAFLAEHAILGRGEECEHLHVRRLVGGGAVVVAAQRERAARLHSHEPRLLRVPHVQFRQRLVRRKVEKRKGVELDVVNDDARIELGAAPFRLLHEEGHLRAIAVDADRLDRADSPAGQLDLAARTRAVRPRLAAANLPHLEIALVGDDDDEVVEHIHELDAPLELIEHERLLHDAPRDVAHLHV